MNDKWNFRVWRAAMSWLAAWMVVMTADAMIHNQFPYAWLPPIMAMATLFYLCPNTTSWHLVALGDWFFELKSNQTESTGLTPISEACFGFSTAVSFFMLWAAMVYAFIADDFPWAGAAVVVYVLFTSVLLEMRVRYVLRKKAPEDATDRA